MSIFTPVSSEIIYSPTSTGNIFTPASPFLPVDVISPFIPISPLSPLSPLYPLSPLSPLTLSFDYSRPLIGVYETIDTNPEVRKKMTDYFYDVIRDKWLLDELNDILNYFVSKDGKISLISSFSGYSPTNISKDTDKIAEKKVEYIEEYFLTKHDVSAILSKFTK